VYSSEVAAMAAVAARGAAARGAAVIVYDVDRDERESMAKRCDERATQSFDLDSAGELFYAPPKICLS
jgi:hypothetical protein